MYQCDAEEEEELALAIQMSLAMDGQGAQVSCCHSGIFLGRHLIHEIHARTLTSYGLIQRQHSIA